MKILTNQKKQINFHSKFTVNNNINFQSRINKIKVS